MNLLHIVHYPVFGGPHNQALRLDRPLRQHGWNTTVLIPDEAGNAGQRLRDGGVDTIEMPLGRLRATPHPLRQARFAARFAADIRNIRRVIRERNIDLVVIGGLVNPQGAIAAKLEKVPVVWQILDTRTPAVLEKATLALVRRYAGAVMTTGHSMANAYRPRLGGVHVEPFYPPVDCDMFSPSQGTRDEVRAEWGVSPGEFVLGSVANINPQKGIEYLVDALPLVKARFPNTRLVLVGAEYDTHRAYSKALRLSMRGHGLKQGRDVVFLGGRDDVERQLQGFDVFAMASVPRSEGTPTSIIEAMACGKPVVATDVGAVKDLVEQSVTGFVIEPMSAEAIAGAVTRLLGSSLESMSYAARLTALQRFDIEACMATHLRAFDVALGARARSLNAA